MEEKNVNLVVGYRKLLGMTQQDMAKEIGVSPQSYSNKERGYRAFTDSEKIKLKRFFDIYFDDVSFDIFFEDNGLRSIK